MLNRYSYRHIDINDNLHMLQEVQLIQIFFSLLETEACNFFSYLFPKV